MKMEKKKSFLEEYWLLIVVIIYILLPIDLIPDRVPLIGTLDDAGLLLVHIIQEYNRWRRENEGKEVSGTSKSKVQEGEIVK